MMRSMEGRASAPRPPVTVLMPVYNGGSYLRQSIGSVLGQTFREFELLIIDDGSTDDSSGIARTFGDSRIRILRNERNAGLVASLNLGLREARGEWIARQDADDLSTPDRIRRQIEFARGNPSVPLLGSDARLIDASNHFAGRWRTAGDADGIRWDLCFRCCFCHGSAFFRRAFIVDRFDGYRNLRACEDFDLWSRVAQDFPVTSLRAPLVHYRIHRASVMGSESRSASEAWRSALRQIVEANLARFVPGLGALERSALTAPWCGEPPHQWDSYFPALTEARRHYLRGRKAGPGFLRLLADQCYMLLGRVNSRKERLRFLADLRAADARIWLAMPWLRVAWMLVRL